MTTRKSTHLSNQKQIYAQGRLKVAERRSEQESQNRPNLRSDCVTPNGAQGRPEFEIPVMIQRSQAAFRQNLPELMKKHYRQWVAFHGEKRIGFATSQRELYGRCLAQGLKPDEFVVRAIGPEMPGEIDIEELHIR